MWTGAAVWFIRTIHVLLVFGLVVAPFVPSFTYKRYALGVLLFLAFHYVTNYGKCGLTEFEGFLLGERAPEGFLYRLIKPVLTLHQQDFYRRIHWIHVGLVVVLLGQIYFYEEAWKMESWTGR